MANTNVPKPELHETRFFADRDTELLQEMRRKKALEAEEKKRKEDAQERQHRKDLHWMCCPKCGMGMTEKELNGVLVDICDACDGVYFDRGELEALLKKQFQETRGFFRRVLGLSYD